MPDQTAETVYKTFLREWVQRYGWPNRIHTDQGTQFESGLFQCMCATLHIEKSRTTPYRPQANGKVERFNRTMATLLRRMVLETGNPEGWEEHLPLAMMAYRTLVSESTGFTPFKMVFGREMRLGVDPTCKVDSETNDPKDHLLKLVEELENTYELARSIIDQRAERAASRLSAKAVQKFYREGDVVRLQMNALARKPPTKLAPRWSLPFIVLKVQGKTVVIKNPRNGVQHRVSHDFLKHSQSANSGAASAEKNPKGSMVENRPPAVDGTVPCTESTHTVPEHPVPDGTVTNNIDVGSALRNHGVGSECEVSGEQNKFNFPNYFSDRLRRIRKPLRLPDYCYSEDYINLVCCGDFMASSSQQSATQSTATSAVSSLSAGDVVQPLSPQPTSPPPSQQPVVLQTQPSRTPLQSPMSPAVQQLGTLSQAGSMPQPFAFSAFAQVTQPPSPYPIPMVVSPSLPLSQNPSMGQAPLYVSGSSFSGAQGVQLPTVPGLTPEQVQAALSVQPPPMDIGPPLSVSQLLAQVATTAGPVLTYLQQSQLQQAVQPQLPLLVMTTGSVTPIVSVLSPSSQTEIQGIIPSHLLSAGSTSASSGSMPSTSTSPVFPQGTSGQGSGSSGSAGSKPIPTIVLVLRQEWNSLSDEQILSDRRSYSRAGSDSNLRMVLEGRPRYVIEMQNLSIKFMLSLMREHLSMYNFLKKLTTSLKGWDPMVFNAVMLEFDPGFSKSGLSGGISQIRGRYRLIVLGAYYRDLILHVLTNYYANTSGGEHLQPAVYQTSLSLGSAGPVFTLAELEALAEGREPRPATQSDLPRIGPTGVQLPSLEKISGVASSSSSTASKGAAREELYTPWVIVHHSSAHYELVGSEPKFVFRGPARIVCVDDTGALLFRECVTLAVPGKIDVCPPLEGQKDPWGGQVPKPYSGETLKVFLSCLQGKYLVVGDASKALKELRLAAPEGCLVEMSSNLAIREKMYTKAQLSERGSIMDMKKPQSLAKVVQLLGDNWNKDSLEDQAYALYRVYANIRGEVEKRFAMDAQVRSLEDPPEPLCRSWLRDYRDLESPLDFTRSVEEEYESGKRQRPRHYKEMGRGSRPASRSETPGPARSMRGPDLSSLRVVVPETSPQGIHVHFGPVTHQNDAVIEAFKANEESTGDFWKSFPLLFKSGRHSTWPKIY